MLASKAQIQEIFGVSATTVQLWCKQGMPAERAGRWPKYDIGECVRWYLGSKATLRDQFDEARIRQINAQTDQILTKTIDVDFAYKVMAGVIQQIASEHRALSTKLRHKIGQEAAAHVREECRKLRERLAKGIRAIDFAEQASDGDGAGAAKIHRPVGRPRKNAPAKRAAGH